MSRLAIRADDLIANICGQINNFDSSNSLSFPLDMTSKKSKIYDPFDIPEIDEVVETDFRKPIEDSSRIKYVNRNSSNMICPECDGEMSRSSEGMSYICDKCGCIEDDIGSEIDLAVVSADGGGNGSSDVVSSYNTSDTSSTPIRISGPNNYIYQKKLISSTSNYKKTQKKNTNDQMINIIYQYKGSTPPNNVVLEAAEYYYEVQQHCIKRGDVRKGTMAACLYRVCESHGITRKPKEIADIFGIPQSEFSNGEKILDDLEARGLIKVIKSNINTLQSNEWDDDEKKMHAFLNRYFESLGIPVDEIGVTFVDRPNYKEFACQLIKFTTKYRIAKSSIMSSKCAGAIYILSTKRSELHIKRDVIEKECVISKSTFSRYSQAVFNMLNSEEENFKKVRSRLRKLFKNYQIPVQ